MTPGLTRRHWAWRTVGRETVWSLSELTVMWCFWSAFYCFFNVCPGWDSGTHATFPDLITSGQASWNRNLMMAGAGWHGARSGGRVSWGPAGRHERVKISRQTCTKIQNGKHVAVRMPIQYTFFTISQKFCARISSYQSANQNNSEVNKKMACVWTCIATLK